MKNLKNCVTCHISEKALRNRRKSDLITFHFIYISSLLLRVDISYNILGKTLFYAALLSLTFSKEIKVSSACFCQFNSKFDYRLNKDFQMHYTNEVINQNKRKFILTLQIVNEQDTDLFGNAYVGFIKNNFFRSIFLC